jgi:hypothetical protein
MLKSEYEMSDSLVGSEMCFRVCVDSGDYRWSFGFGPLNLGYVQPSTMTFTPSVFWRSLPFNPDRASPIIPV